MISILFELARFCSSVSFLCIPLMLHCSIFRLFVLGCVGVFWVLFVVGCEVAGGVWGVGGGCWAGDATATARDWGDCGIGEAIATWACGWGAVGG